LMRLDNTVAEDGCLLRGEQARQHHEPVPREVALPLVQRFRRRHGRPAAQVIHHRTSRIPPGGQRRLAAAGGAAG